MASCYSELWTMKDLTDALKSMHKENKVIVVPRFQRGKRWKADQENKFIDSLKKGYPVGTMLFYKQVENNKEIYTLVDGLQRGNTIKKFMSSPTKYFSEDSIDEKICNDIFISLGLHGSEKQIKSIITKTIADSIGSLNSVQEVETYEIAKSIIGQFSIDDSKILDLVIKTLRPFIKAYKDNYEEISKSTIPVIVYSGDEDSLPIIFDRINTQGTPLTQYEVYAASWPFDKKFKINNDVIIEKIMKKYDYLADDDYTVYGYDRNELRITKSVSAFEYLFGLSKFLNFNYKFLHYEKNQADDEINSIAFELVNACLNDGRDGIKTLYSQILSIDINLFEERLIEAIDFVEKVIAPITKFKGNSRNDDTLLYSKFQILSMIAATFREKYDAKNMTVSKKTWAENKHILQKNMLSNFVYDIITNEWSNGGTDKIHKASKPNKYLKEIPKGAWESALNGLYEQEKMRNEKRKVASPSNADIVFLNCIYLSIFTALDQLSLANFDIEHISPKDQIRKLITTCNEEGLPISCIANLCYLPECINRSKGSKNFYQDVSYLKKVNLNYIEEKYSFTKKENLEWMDLPYSQGDYQQLKEYYEDFLNYRFQIQKEKFFSSMEIK